jgi:biofilm PGA synthesis N-glycosyltransferase PgaC
MAAQQDAYVIVTPAYNEARHIAHTFRSVVHQTILPRRWVIVDDGSTDETAAVVRSFLPAWDFVRYVRRERVSGQAYYASNVHAIMEGVRHVREERYDFLAVLDADIVLPEDYYEQLLARFRADPRLGVASGVYDNLVNGCLRKVLNDRRFTPKAIQVFRRKCFEDIGGYLPLKYGGEDTCACIMARMSGWVAWSFPDLRVVHRRPTGLGNAGSLLRVRFRQGLCDYGLGTHPLFMIAKCLRRCVRGSPPVLGGLLRLAGYFYGYLIRESWQVPAEVAAHVRQEQMRRLWRCNRIVDRDNPGFPGLLYARRRFR